MTIGIPKAFLYYEHGVLWQRFFKELGCQVLTSPNTNEAVFLAGAKATNSECCLPARVYMGHIKALLDKCDYILAPYASREKGGHALCTRFWGIGDVLRHTFEKGDKFLHYPLHPKSERAGFYAMAKKIGYNTHTARRAYLAAKQDQDAHAKSQNQKQETALESSGHRVMLAGRPYVMHDPYIGGTVSRILTELGCTVLYSDRCGSGVESHASTVSPGLYWAHGREAIGATVANKDKICGAVLLTVFPCATDALQWEMATRNIRNLPITTISLDGLHGDAGLETRLESFVDML